MTTLFEMTHRVSGASFSPCKQYRWSLWRHEFQCPPERMCAFIGLNPSTADETQDDPTIRRCIRFTREWGYDGLVMLNLFAFRATDPKVMKAQTEPVGADNDEVLLKASRKVGLVIAAWGTHGEFKGRGDAVRRLLKDCRLHHLGLSKDGHPKHPLYLKADTKPTLWI